MKTAFYLRRGDFHRIIDGELVKQEEKGQKARKNDKYTRVPNAHPAIISRELFDVVQKKLAENNGKHRKTTDGEIPHQGARASGNEGRRWRDQDQGRSFLAQEGYSIL
jgi:hypothetical protein